MEICSNNKAKHRSQKLAFGIFRLLSLCIVLILFAILGFIIYKGSGAISWEFITSAPTDRAVFGYFVHSVKAEIIVAFQVRFHLQNGIQYRVSGRSHFSGTHFF